MGEARKEEGEVEREEFEPEEGVREPVRGGGRQSENGAGTGDKEASSLMCERGGFKPIGFGGNVARSSLTREKG
ncbi:hypothetical protein IEQ34_010816 [Dendrobium chrysotoxum]|uniref:Uncharacterized protein n=1 Tax=Dendrobium chrysotoxum TaxID=161865 RepID=A0AAV7GWY3_DENCH|nr:hypothetical protein IEQ34_010816 [Dendrobium chrysotoxum]